MLQDLELVWKCFTTVSIIAGGGWALLLFLRSQQIQKAQLYKDLQFKAIDLFLEAVRKPELNRIYDPNFEIPATDASPARLQQWPDSARPLFDYAYSVLNLFELTFNLQKRRLITEEIFLTWVAWYWDFSRGSFALWLWKDARWNYSSDFMKAMDKFFAIKEDGWREAYQFLDHTGIIRYDLDKWFATHAGRDR
jgi:hypothetical protein